jgi:acyl-coenzyme A synthetase/AMP-(fatty) acid ligase
MSEIREETRNATGALIDRHIAANAGDRRALAYGAKSYSYHDLAALTNRAGNMLRALGVGPAQRVLLALAPSPAFYACLLGAMKIGAVPVIPLEAGGAALCLRQARPAAVIADAGRVDALAGELGEARLVVAGEASGGHPSLVALLREAASSLAGEKLGSGAPALLLFGDKASTTLSHGEIGEIAAGAAPPAALAVHGLGEALGRLARGQEIAIAPGG